MFRLFLIFLLGMNFPLITLASIPVEVLEIYDGDTIKVKLDSNNKFSIRLVEIDCFETSKIHRAYKQAYVNNLKIEQVVKQGNSTTKVVQELYKNSKNASFDFQGIDKYSRALGIVYFDELNVNKYLLDNKICLPYEYIDN